MSTYAITRDVLLTFGTVNVADVAEAPPVVLISETLCDLVDGL